LPMMPLPRFTFNRLGRAPPRAVLE